MNKEDILLFDSVISDLTKLRGQHLERFQLDATDLASRLLHIDTAAKEYKRLTSKDLNIFRMLGVGETMHSYLLAHLLDPHAEHGQKHLFLNIFLKLLGIKNSDSENWTVTAEKGRIDILLRRVTPHSVIVIENKSNYAPDQDNQLYRYWYQEIYSKICNTDIDSLNPPNDRYQLIYLSPALWKIPSDNSLMKPKDWDEKLPDEVPIKPKHLLFSVFIVKWLENSLETLPKENHRIREHIKQYLELWN
jgi:hypothetical protein